MVFGKKKKKKMMKSRGDDEIGILCRTACGRSLGGCFLLSFLFKNSFNEVSLEYSKLDVLEMYYLMTLTAYTPVEPLPQSQ